MTSKRKDNHSTEFGLWLREQPEIDSQRGYVATNIDFCWRNYKNGKWMFIEEKRFNSKPALWQKQMFKLIDWCARKHPRYKGFYVLQFENTNPDDGRMKLNGKEINREQLIDFLQFKDNGAKP